MTEIRKAFLHAVFIHFAGGHCLFRKEVIAYFKLPMMMEFKPRFPPFLNRKCLPELGQLPSFPEYRMWLGRILE